MQPRHELLLRYAELRARHDERLAGAHDAPMRERGADWAEVPHRAAGRRGVVLFQRGPGAAQTTDNGREALASLVSRPCPPHQYCRFWSTPGT